MSTMRTYLAVSAALASAGPIACSSTPASPGAASTSTGHGGAMPATKPSIPVVGDCWKIADVPILGPAFDNPPQQPVDFAIWPAADDTWQLWSCIRATKEEGNSRLFHRWEGSSITAKDWTPKGIAMRAGRVVPDGIPNDGKYDPSFGESQGGLQAPYVWRDGKTWRMVYGTWGDLGMQTSTDGKTFTRVLQNGNDVRIFPPATDGKRDPMLLPYNGTDHLYFTANSSVDVATSTDGKTFSAPKEVARGGKAGMGGSDAECPFVIRRDDGYFYLFRTSQVDAPCNYCPGVKTFVYASTDPTDFGRDDDSKLVATLPIAAPEIHTVAGTDYVARLLDGINGIQVCNLNWQAPK